MKIARHLIGTAAAAALMCPLSICVAADNTSSSSAGSSSSSAQMAGATANPQQETEHFFKENASDNTFEVKAAQLAQERATDDQVKKVAQTIAQDHQQANQQLQQIAQKNNITVNPDEMNPVHQAMYDDLQKKQGEEFTRCYVFDMAGGHHADVFKLNYAATKGSGPTKEYATAVLPHIRHHLSEFDRISRSMSGEMARGSEKSKTGGSAGASGSSGDTAQPAGAGQMPDESSFPTIHHDPNTGGPEGRDKQGSNGSSTGSGSGSSSSSSGSGSSSGSSGSTR